MEIPVSPPTASEKPSETPHGKTGGPTIQFVGFSLSDVDYAFEIRRIQEIILMPPITKIPQMPVWIEGLINLRGSVIPVVSLRRRFDLEDRPTDDDTRIIVLNVGSKTVGVVVDSVSRVMKLSPDQIQPPPVTIDAIERSTIQGVARVEEKLVVILDVDRMFPLESLKTHTE